MAILDLSPDELLTTTRAVRKRLDLERAVDLALVREVRRLDLPTGRIALRLAGVPQGIEARSVQG